MGLVVLAAACGSEDTDGTRDGDGGDGAVGTFGDAGGGRPATASCLAAETAHASVGCEYWATQMDISTTATACFAAFVANTWTTPVHIEVAYEGKALPIEKFARIPVGGGASLAYAPYDPRAGLPPGEVAIFFLAGETGAATRFKPLCPVSSAIPGGTRLLGELGEGVTGIGHSFRIRTDAPVVAYQINPYGGGSAAVTGASLLLPTSVWHTRWGTPDTERDGGATFTSSVSYGYPAGMNVAPINPVELTLR